MPQRSGHPTSDQCRTQADTSPCLGVRTLCSAFALQGRMSIQVLVSEKH